MKINFFKKLSAGILLSCLVFSRLSFAEEPQLTATLDKQSARINEEIHLNVKIAGIRGSIQAPKLPSLEGFEIFYQGRGSRFSFINGQTESLTEFNYVLIPRSAGQFVLRPIEITVDNRTYQTNQLEIKVENTQTQAQTQRYQPIQQQQQPTTPTPFQLPATPSQPTPQAPLGQGQSVSSLQADLDDNIFIRVTPSANTIYTNQQLILSYSLFTRYDTHYEGFVEEPETSGFWTEEFPMEQNVERGTETHNGKKYVRADVKKLALFPTSPGQYQIKPGVIKTSVTIEEPNSSIDQFFNNSFFSGSGMFSRRVEKHLIPPTIQVNVKPLPEQGKPNSFKGAVGEFRMATTVDKRVVNQNEAVTFTITIEGEGNIETLVKPVLSEISNVKTYEADTKTELFKNQNLIAGRKTFEVVMIPSEAGEFSIPPVEFSFFNPRTERYVTVKSDSYKIKVNPSKTPPPVLPKELQGADGISKKEIQSEFDDIQYIKERVSGEKINFLTNILGSLGVINLLLTFFAVGFAIARRRDEYLDQNVSLKRTLYAKKFAGRGLRRLDQLANSSRNAQSDETFFEESAKILNQYLADKLNLSAHGLTLDLIQTKLEAKNMPPEIIQSVRSVYEVSDQVRFGKLDSEGMDRKKLVELIREIIYSMERK